MNNKRVSKLSGDQKKELFWTSIQTQTLNDLRGTLTSTAIEAHTRNENTGRTSIMEAALNGKQKSLDTLLDWYERRRELRSKGWIDLKDEDEGRTALMLAAGAGHIDCVKSLIRFGAKLDLKDDQNLTAKDIAERHKKSAVIALLNEVLNPQVEESEEEETEVSHLTTTQRNKLKKKELLASEGIKKDTPQPSQSSLSKLERDKSVTASWDEVNKLFESFDQLRAIHDINISKPDADSCDLALFTCHWLKSLRMKLSPRFDNLPGDKLAQLQELQQLILSGNTGLTKLPNEIGKLSKLRILEVEGCALPSLPDSIGELSNLESLNVANNKMKTVSVLLCALLDTYTLYPQRTNQTPFN